MKTSHQWYSHIFETKNPINHVQMMAKSPNKSSTGVEPPKPVATQGRKACLRWNLGTSGDPGGGPRVPEQLFRRCTESQEIWNKKKRDLKLFWRFAGNMEICSFAGICSEDLWGEVSNGEKYEQWREDVRGNVANSNLNNTPFDQSFDLQLLKQYPKVASLLGSPHYCSIRYT